MPPPDGLAFAFSCFATRKNSTCFDWLKFCVGMKIIFVLEMLSDGLKSFSFVTACEENVGRNVPRCNPANKAGSKSCGTCRTRLPHPPVRWWNPPPYARKVGRTIYAASDKQGLPQTLPCPSLDRHSFFACLVNNPYYKKIEWLIDCTGGVIRTLHRTIRPSVCHKKWKKFPHFQINDTTFSSANLYIFLIPILASSEKDSTFHQKR